MKKFMVIGLMLLICVPAFAQNRGSLPNVFASWYSVTATQETITFTPKSRDLAIHNGSTVPIAIDLKGGVIPNSLVDDGVASPSIFQLEGNTAISLRDYVTESISMVSGEGTASPVSVIITY